MTATPKNALANCDQLTRGNETRNWVSIGLSSGGKFMDKPVGISSCLEKLPERQ